MVLLYQYECHEAAGVAFYTTKDDEENSANADPTLLSNVAIAVSNGLVREIEGDDESIFVPH